MPWAVWFARCVVILMRLPHLFHERKLLFPITHPNAFVSMPLVSMWEASISS